MGNKKERPIKRQAAMIGLLYVQYIFYVLCMRKKFNSFYPQHKRNTFLYSHHQEEEIFLPSVSLIIRPVISVNIDLKFM